MGSPQVDIATLDEHGYTFYECKYTRERIGNPVIARLIKKAEQSSLKPYRLGFISKSGFEDNVDRKKYVTYTLDDFYGERP